MNNKCQKIFDCEKNSSKLHKNTFYKKLFYIFIFKCKSWPIACFCSLGKNRLQFSTTKASSKIRRRNLKTAGKTRKTHQMFSVHATLKEFKKGRFNSETHQMLPSTPGRRNFKAQRSPAILDFSFEETSVRKITWLSWRHRFQKLRFQMFSVLAHENEKPEFSNSSGLKSIFKKLCFCDRLLRTVGLNRRNNATFSDFLGVVWTLPDRTFCCWQCIHLVYLSQPVISSKACSALSRSSRISRCFSSSIALLCVNKKQLLYFQHNTKKKPV